jgi:pilus assembly protein Flp/PilA
MLRTASSALSINDQFGIGRLISDQASGRKADRAFVETEGTAMSKIFKTFIRDESGATAIEYGLIAALVGVAIIAGVKALGTTLSGTFAKVSGNL